MASSDYATITLTGRGGHGAMPHKAADPVVAAASLVMALQTVVARNTDPHDPAVVTVGAINAGSDNNVIPSSATVKVNLRWFNEKTRNTLLEGIKRINEGIAVANGLSKDLYPTIKMKGKVFPLENDVALTNKVNAALGQVVPPANIITTLPAFMGSEDFQHLVRDFEKTKSNYIMLGVANPDDCAKAAAEGKSAPFFLHGNNYQVDLRAIPLGTEIGTTALMAVFNLKK
jgi:hippurate hydrolase